MNNSTTLNNTLRSKILMKASPYRGFSQSLRYIFGIFEGVLSPVIIIVNIIVLVAILRNSKLRQKFPYLIIVSISVSEVITGLLSCPVRANVILSKNYSHGCAAYVFITVYEEFVQNFVALWSLVGLNADYLISLFNIRLPQLSEFRRKLVMATLIFLPWLIMCCIVFPVAFTYYGKVYFTKRFCQVILRRTGKMVILHMAYVVPAILLAIQVVLITITHAYRRRNAMPMTSETISPVMCIVASLVVVLLVSPQQVAALIGRYKLRKLEFKGLLTLLYTAIALSDLTAAVLPCVWFLCEHIRASCLELYNKMPWRRSVDVFQEDLSVTYKNFE